jgi:hypothetical protein
VEAAGSDGLTAAEAAAQRLRIDYASAEVLRAFQERGIQAVLLKGAAIVRWLYEPSERRAYADCDLLVSPDSTAAAGEILSRLGFEPELEVAEMPAWWLEHGVEWLRASDGAAIDLHRTLAGARATPERVWTVLSHQVQPIEIAGFTAQSLDLPGIVLHLALHVAQHGGIGRHVRELELAVIRADEATWRAVADLAREIDAGAALVTGLRLAPSGAALADRLDVPAASSVEVHLRAQGVAHGLTVARFAEAGSVERLAIVRHKVVPPATFMRKWSPLARRGRLGLAAAYLWRPVWLLSRTPRALREWRSAKRASRP